MRRAEAMLIIIGLSLMPAIAGASALSDAAARLAPGAWVEITTTNQQSLLIRSNGGDLMEYGNKMYWDPGSRQMFFCGASHHGTFSQDCVKYNDDSNSWSSIGLFASGSGPDPISHTYDNSAGDPTRGHFYHHAYNSLITYRYKISTGTWSSLPAFNMVSGQSLQCCISIEYALNMDRLILLHPWSNTLHFYSENSNTWETPNVTDIGNGAYHTLSAYGSDNGGYYLFGGGAQTPTTIARVNGSRAVSAAATPAGSWDILHSVVAADPVTGKVLQFPGGSTIREYNAASNSWRDTGITARFQSSGDNSSCLVGPISTYGVIMMVCSTNSQTVAHVYLYKHTSGGSPSPKPAPPPALSVR